jgi:hypothetical protein
VVDRFIRSFGDQDRDIPKAWGIERQNLMVCGERRRWRTSFLACVPIVRTSITKAADEP